MSKDMLLKPRMSEKAFALSQALNTYVFDVPKTANKLTVADAVNAQFGVTVEDVRIAVSKGKAKKSYQKRNRPMEGRRVDVKRAYVRVKAGETIAIFGVEDDKKEKKDAKKAADSTTAKPTVKPAQQSKVKGGLRGVLSRSPRQTQNKGGDK